MKHLINNFYLVLVHKIELSSLTKMQTVKPSLKGKLKGFNQSWVFFGRTDAKAETPILLPSNVKNWLIGKDPDAGKD